MRRKWISHSAMSRPAREALGVLRILREVLAIPVRNPWLMASVLLLLLLPCNLLVTLFPLTLRLPVKIPTQAGRLLEWVSPVDAAEPGGPPPAKVFHINVAPLAWVVAELSSLAVVYLSAVACKGKNSTLGALLSKVRRSWKKVAISYVYANLFFVIYLCLYVTLPAAVALAASWISTMLLSLVVIISLSSAICFALVVLFYLNIACELSLVISAVEEDKCGLAAMAKAVSLTKGRRVQGLLLMALCFVLDELMWKDYRKTGEEEREMALLVVAAWRLPGVLVGLATTLFEWLLWTVYYYECKKSHGSKGGRGGGVDEGESLIPVRCSSDVGVLNLT